MKVAKIRGATSCVQACVLHLQAKVSAFFLHDAALDVKREYS